MTNPFKFRVQAGDLIFEMEGDPELVQQQMDLHRDHIDLILSEQAKIIKGGKKRRGRPGGPGRPRGEGAGRRPGRQPVIKRESELRLKPRQQARLAKYLDTVAGGGQLGKDATVFAIAWFICSEVLGQDTFTAGDVIAGIQQVGPRPSVPSADAIDVVQMLRNLAAASIGKEWVARNADGTFSLTDKGKAVGATGEIIRPRGRRPSSPKPESPSGTRRGRPRKEAAG